MVVVAAVAVVEEIFGVTPLVALGSEVASAAAAAPEVAAAAEAPVAVAVAVEAKPPGAGAADGVLV